jgi:type I restriction enzyme, S subunit
MTDWQTVKLGDVAYEVSDRVENPSTSGYDRFVGLEHFVSGDFKIKGWGGTNDLVSTMKSFKAGDTLFARRNAYLKRASMVEFDGICSGDAIVLRNNEKMIDGFLPLVLNTDHFWNYAIANAAGSMSKRVRVEDLMKYEFLLPPLDEQQNVADLLWAADDVVNEYIGVVDKLLIIQKIQSDSWLSQNGENTVWKEVILNDVCIIQSGQIDPKQSPYAEMIHIASDDIESGTGRILEMNTAAQDKVISGNYLFNEKAIVYSKIRPNLRKVAFPKFSGVCSADAYPIYSKDNILPELLFLLLLSETFTTYAVSCSARSAFPKINREALLSYKFRLPPKAIQERIVEESFATRDALENARIHIENSKILRRELLNRSFS